MTQRPLIAGNWKMNTSSREEAVALAGAIAAVDFDGVDVVVCPPFPWLLAVRDAIAESQVALGAQNCWYMPNGAVTGEVSTKMLSGLCEYVILGHSERRRLFEESDAIVREKIGAVLRAAMTPILCVGETLEIRERGDAVEHVTSQLVAALGGRPPTEVEACVVAYEPVWAIGTGIAASASDAESMAVSIRESIVEISAGVPHNVRVLYGGSVTPTNSAEILSQPHVGGALVGGASLDLDAFVTIARSVRI